MPPGAGGTPGAGGHAQPLTPLAPDGSAQPLAAPDGAGAAGERGARARVASLLEALGEDAGRLGLADTPKRVVGSFRERLAGYRAEPAAVVGGAVFQEAGEGEGGEAAGSSAGSAASLVLVGDIDFNTVSEADFMPLFGTCHVAYLPGGGRVIGLSKVARVVELLARRVQGWEGMAAEVAAALQGLAALAPRGVAVCIDWRNVGPGPRRTETSTAAGTGCFAPDGPAARGGGAAAAALDDLETLLLSRGAGATAARRAGGGVLGLLNRAPPLAPWASPANPQLPWLRGLAKRRRPAAFRARLEAAAQAVVEGAVAGQALGREAEARQLSRLSEKGTGKGFAEALSEATLGSVARLEDIAEGAAAGAPDRAPKRWKREVDRDPVIRAPFAQVCVPFYSSCEHHLLPFHGRVYIGYEKAGHAGLERPGREIELDAIHRLVLAYSCRLQLQERIADQIADGMLRLGAPGVVVMIHAAHSCMCSRGVAKAGSTTTTCTRRGSFGAEGRDERLKALGRRLGRSFAESIREAPLHGWGPTGTGGDHGWTGADPADVEGQPRCRPAALGARWFPREGAEDGGLVAGHEAGPRVLGQPPGLAAEGGVTIVPDGA